MPSQEPTPEILRFDLGDQVNFGFLHAVQKNAGERVLLDPPAAHPR